MRSIQSTHVIDFLEGLKRFATAPLLALLFLLTFVPTALAQTYLVQVNVDEEYMTDLTIITKGGKKIILIHLPTEL